MNDKKLYFEVPTQVAFWEDNHYIGGVAYGDEIICVCCGGVVSIEEVYEFAPEGIEPIVAYDIWRDVNRNILDVNEENFRMED